MHSSQRERKRNLLRNLLIILICIAVFVGGIIGYLYFNDSSGPLDVSVPYQINSSDDQTRTVQNVSLQAPAFASDLVVSDANLNESGKIQLKSTEERALLFNLDSGSPIYARHIYDRVFPASITKVMTALLAVQQGKMDDVVEIDASDVALSRDSQMAGLKAGDKVTLKQLFSALLVYSANDAAMAIARFVGGTREKFVEMMNEEAKKLGMTGTHFVNPHGLHDENHYTTPYDIYLMLNEAIKYPEITDVMKNSIYKLEITGEDGTVHAVNLTATDHYISGEKTLQEGITIMAGKTGTTDEAGNCLALAVQNSYGIPYIAIVMHAPNKDTLYEDMDKLLKEANK